MTRHLAAAIVIVLSSAALVVAMLGSGAANAAEVSAHPDRFIVKYRKSVAACAHCLLARGVPFASVTGRDSLDKLNERFRVRAVRPLFAHEDSLTAGRDAAQRARMEKFRARYRARAARASANATLPDLSNVYVVEVPSGTASDAAAAFAADPDVEYATPDHVIHIDRVPNDPFFSSTGSWRQPYADLWGLHTIDAETAWDTAIGEGMVVAVIDTGIRYTHQDIRDNVWTNAGEIAGNHVDDDGNGFVDDVYGWDFTTNRNRPLDRNGHGTHVAGTIAATGDNARGVVGVAFGARVMAVEGLDKYGNGYESDLAQAIVYAAENGADVLNNSWGGGGDSPVITDAIATATGLGAVVVFAAGNFGYDTAYFGGPATLPEVIAVAATESGDTRAAFSNYGDAVSVSAPGVDILSLKGGNRTHGKNVHGGLQRLSGTSMATPHVAGLAAVLLSAQPDLTLDEVRWHLELNADQPGLPGYEGLPRNPGFGWGRINAGRVFVTPPVTTRIGTKPFLQHAFADTTTPGALRLDFSFTSRDPVGWTISGPAWLTPSVAAGSGTASVAASLDTSGLAPGTHAAPLTVSAPAAADGGASLPTTIEVHRNTLAGDELLVAPNVGRPNLLYRAWDLRPRVAPVGTGAMVAWVDTLPSGWANIVVARVDQSGTVGAPSIVANTPTQKDPGALAIATDGNIFLVAWRDLIETNGGDTRLHEKILGVRVSATGTPLDATPLVLGSRLPSVDGLITAVEAAFDGTAFTVLWSEAVFSAAGDIDRLFGTRVATDGSMVQSAIQLYLASGSGTIVPARPSMDGRPKLACASSGCMVVWLGGLGTQDSHGFYIVNMYGLRWTGSLVAGAQPFLVLEHVGGGVESLASVLGFDWLYAFPCGIATDGTDYLVVSGRKQCRYDDCDPYGFFNDVVAARVSGSGVTLDTTPLRLDDPPGGFATMITRGLTFDGTNYVAAFSEIPSPETVGYLLPSGFPVFARRVSPAGVVLDDESVGLMLHADPNVMAGTLLSAGGQSLLVWRDTRGFSFENGLWGSIYAQWLNP